MFFNALKEHAEGKLPFGLDWDLDYRTIRALAIRHPGRGRALRKYLVDLVH